MDAEIKAPATIVPPLTPFTADQKVDFPVLKRIVDYVIDDCDATMLIAAGVEAQEYQYLDLASRRELISKTLEFAAGRKPVAVGISHPSYRVAIELAEFAAQQGATALQLLAPLRPTGGQPRARELVSYFDAVLEHTALPCILYINPGPGADVGIEATVALSRLDKIAYVKESSRNLARVALLIEEVQHAGYAQYFTTMQMHLATLALGASGVTLPPPVAYLARLINMAFEAGDWHEAARLQRQLSVFPAQWMESGLTAVMKAALEHLGLPVGGPYPPYEPVSGDRLKALGALLDKTDIKKIGEI